MNMRKAIFSVIIALVCAGCPSPSGSEREAIEAIITDLEAGAQSGDLMRIDRHLSSQAKAGGFEANRFLMECSYGDVAKPAFTARTIQVMGDSAHVDFAILRAGAQYLIGMRKSDVRLMKSGRWQIVSYELLLNP
jgi:hypothetical protein